MGPVQGMSAGGPRTRAGQGLPETYPPRLLVSAGSGKLQPTPPHPVTNTRSTSRTGGSGTTGGAGEVVRQGNWVGGVGSGMGDGSGSEEVMREVPRETMIPGMWVLEGVVALVVGW